MSQSGNHFRWSRAGHIPRRGALAVALIVSPLALLIPGAAGRMPRAHAAQAVAPAAPSPAAARYGTDGHGDPRTADCTATVAPGKSIDAAIKAAGPRGVICVKPGDYHGQMVDLNRPALTVRSIGVATIKGAVVTGDRSTLDGFTVVGGAYQKPEAGILFGGTGQQIIHNLIRGAQLIYGVRCVQGKCNNALVAHDTVTGIQNYGMFIDAGSGSVIEWNNIYDLHSPLTTLDTDGIRFWGDQTFRNNYIHDINQFKSAKDSSGDTPHTDCFQTYDNGTISSGTVIEDNYCVRVSRQCLIAQNDVATTYQISNITFRDNVCETYDAQSINLGSMKGMRIYNNLILSGFFDDRQIVSEEQQDDGPAMGPPNTDTTIANNILVRAKKSSFTYERIGAATNEHFLNNLEMLDTSIAPRDNAFQSTRNAYPAYRNSDFTSYHAYDAALLVMDRGVPGNTAKTDLAGKPRVAGRSIDLGPWELGGCGQRC